MGRERTTSWIPGETLRATNRHPLSYSASLSTSQEARAQKQFVEWRSEWLNKRMKKCPIRLKLWGSSWWSGLQGSPRAQRRENGWAVSSILSVSFYQCSQVSSNTTYHGTFCSKMSVLPHLSSLSKKYPYNVTAPCISISKGVLLNPTEVF